MISSLLTITAKSDGGKNFDNRSTFAKVMGKNVLFFSFTLGYNPREPCIAGAKIPGPKRATLFFYTSSS